MERLAVQNKISNNVFKLPFGEEIQSGTGGRNSAQGYGGQDSVRQKFTGYERDAETDLDFAQARMYNKNHGRFTSVDPIAGILVNPQSHNKYAYVWNNPLILTDPTGLIVSWEDSEKKKKEGETEAKTDKQRAYEKRLEEMIKSDDKKTRENGLKLKATYERLQKSDITFHVVAENPSGASSGELTYKGEEGHLYINLKGDNNAYGALTDTQKIAHEFKHGEQFLDGKIGFLKNDKGEWKGYRDDLPDEAEAFITGFEAEPLDPTQRGGTTGAFLNSIGNAMPFGLNAVVDALDRSGPYKGRTKTQLEMRFIGGKVPPNVYAVPKK
jgi:RHS repeat-associated protein